MSDHALTHPGGYLRQHRVRLTLWIAVLEGILSRGDPEVIGAVVGQVIAYLAGGRKK